MAQSSNGIMDSVEINGYRGLASYRLANLASVNLIVGNNNCGKTSILEALGLLVSGGNISVISQIGTSRSENSLPYSSRKYGRMMDFSNIFHGHSFKLGASFDLSANDGERSLAVSLEEFDESTSDAYSEIHDSDESDSDLFAYVMKIVTNNKEEAITFPAREDGIVFLGRSLGLNRNRYPATPTRFLTVDSFDPAKMGEFWNTALEDRREAEIVEDMKILVPSLESMHFLAGRMPSSGILLDLASYGKRVPISTFGDGLRRLLALRLSFIGATNGLLLVDEIDTGLHWTVMQEMWKFVVEIADRNNVQVFATTHSYDCIRGLASLIDSRPDLSSQVSLQKMTPSLKQSVCFTGEQIKIAVGQDIEVR